MLGDTTMTGAETSAAGSVGTSRRSVPSVAVAQGGSAALLSLNRPEVLLIIGASQVLGTRRTALHPLGSLDDHAYALVDAGISTLIVDPVLVFVERTLGLLERVPALNQVLTIGPVPDALAHVWRDSGRGSGVRAQPLAAALLSPDHIVSITYTGGTTGSQRASSAPRSRWPP